MDTNTRIDVRRLRNIHRMADEYLAEMQAGKWSDTASFCMGDNVWWDRGELLTWYSRREQLRAALRSEPNAKSVIWVTEYMDRGYPCQYGHAYEVPATPGCIEALRFGLVITREMLTEHASPVAVTFRGIDPAYDAPVDIKEACHRFNIEQEPERTGPFGGNDATHEAFIAASQRAADEMSGARAALVARLEAEHVKASELTGLLHPRPHWSGRNAGRRVR